MDIKNLSKEILLSLKGQAIEALTTETFKDDDEFTELLRKTEEELRNRYK